MAISCQRFSHCRHCSSELKYWLPFYQLEKKVIYLISLHTSQLPLPELSPVVTFLIPFTFLFFTQHCREGTGLQFWALEGLVRGKSYFIFAQAQVLCVHVCVCVDWGD